MPALKHQKPINLLPRQNWEKKPLFKFLNWSLGIGRYIVIVTELVVIISFISRFKLDRDMTDLYEELETKGAQIKSQEKFEKEFRQIQKKAQVIKQLSAAEDDKLKTLNALSALVPTEVTLENLEIDKNKISLNGYSLTTTGISTFINKLINSDEFGQINLESISRDIRGISFKLSFQIKSAQSEKKASTTPINKNQEDNSQKETF